MIEAMNLLADSIFVLIFFVQILAKRKNLVRFADLIFTQKMYLKFLVVQSGVYKANFLTYDNRNL